MLRLLAEIKLIVTEEEVEPELNKPPFSFHIRLVDGLGSILRPNTPCLYSKMTELETKYQLVSRDSLQKM